jgi:dihydroorotate dehydrogenase
VHKIPGMKGLMKSMYTVSDKRLERTIFGITFPNPVGLAAGFDKDARMISELDSLGFGFIEIGTLTPKAQNGNPKPRMFRLSEDQALINRMGFNNQGVDIAINHLKKKGNVIVGGNIGMNKTTANKVISNSEKGIDDLQIVLNDYLYALESLYPYVDYFVVNVSSPNTPGLRALQEKEPLSKILRALQQKRDSYSNQKAILVKISPDRSKQQLDDIIEMAKEINLDGIIATNTTISRENLKTPKTQIEEIGAGGLSGKPVREKSTEVISYLSKSLGKDFPIIGVGGIYTPEDALEKLEAGACLIQVYSGFIYEGPSMVKKINKAILKNS